MLSPDFELRQLRLDQSSLNSKRVDPKAFLVYDFLLPASVTTTPASNNMPPAIGGHSTR